jgi:hypothetical protein
MQGQAWMMDERQPRMIRWDGKTWALMISERNKEN